MYWSLVETETCLEPFTPSESKSEKDQRKNSLFPCVNGPLRRIHTDQKWKGK